MQDTKPAPMVQRSFTLPAWLLERLKLKSDRNATVRTAVSEFLDVQQPDAAKGGQDAGR